MLTNDFCAERVGCFIFVVIRITRCSLGNSQKINGHVLPHVISYLRQNREGWLSSGDLQLLSSRTGSVSDSVIRWGDVPEVAVNGHQDIECYDRFGQAVVKNLSHEL